MTTLPDKQSEPRGTATETRARFTGERRRWWQFRAWHGMTAPAWFRLLWENRFAVSPARCYLLLLISLTSLLNSVFALLQTAIFGRRIERTRLRQDPITPASCCRLLIPGAYVAMLIVIEPCVALDFCQCQSYYFAFLRNK